MRFVPSVDLLAGIAWIKIVLGFILIVFQLGPIEVTYLRLMHGAMLQSFGFLLLGILRVGR